MNWFFLEKYFYIFENIKMKTTSQFSTVKYNMEKAIAAEKCWKCKCQQSSIALIESNINKLNEEDRKEIEPLLFQSKETFQPPEYDCLGCKTCFPAIFTNELLRVYSSMEFSNIECLIPDYSSEKRKGWPPYPGKYDALRYQAPVAVCTLSSDFIKKSIQLEAPREISIVGTLQTENLGIERLIENIISNPNIRFLVVCGSDSQQVVGHYPGQSLVSLAKSGLDEKGHIVGARGKRPIIKNIYHEAVEHFRKTIEVIDLVGVCEPEIILQKSHECDNRYPGQAPCFEQKKVVPTIEGYIPLKMTSDPLGYFIIFVDEKEQVIFLEHYTNDGLIELVVKGKTVPELYFPVIEKGFISRLDHSAYLGQELARAEFALKTGAEYVQDLAPELRLTSNGKNKTK